MVSKSSSRLFVALGGLLVVLAGGAGCPSANDSRLEAARFALDKCFPADRSDTSQNACKSALADACTVLGGTISADGTSCGAVPAGGDVTAATIASSASLGLAGIDFLQLVKELVEVQSSDNPGNDFSDFKTFIDSYEADNGLTINLTALDESVTVLVTTLTGLTAEESNEISNAFFQMGAVQALDGFIRPAKLITFTPGTNDIDPGNIGGDEFDLINRDFLQSDDNLSSSGTTDDNTLKAVREAYCRCTVNAASVGGWTEACLRDVMRCNLSENATEDTEQDYDGNSVLTGDRTDDCGILNASGTALDNCKARNTGS